MPYSLLPLAHRMAGHAAIVILSLGGFAAVDFRDQITLGSIIVTVVIIAVAGLFTIRAKIADVWREEAEGEKAKAERLQAELSEERRSRVEFDSAQQELRHDLKDKIAGLTAQLKVMEARTDLTAALEAIKHMNDNTVMAISAAIGEGLASAANGSLERDDKTHSLLQEIRDKLPETKGTP